MSDFDKCIKLWREYQDGNITSKDMQKRCCELLNPQQALQFSMLKFEKCKRPLTRGKE